MRRPVILALLTAILIIGGAASHGTARAAQQQIGAIQMSVQAGNQGHFRAGKWLPLVVSVSNTGSAVSGELRVGGGAQSVVRGSYSTPVELPTKSDKQVFLEVVPEAYTQQVQVDLVADDGTLLQSASTPLSYVPPDKLLVGVVTELPIGAISLTSARKGEIVQTDLQLEALPPLEQAFEPLTMLLFTDADSGKLSLQTRQAIDNYVLNGGHLVVTGGPNWQKTGAGFEGLLPLAAGASMSIDSMSALAEFTGAPTAKSLASSAIVATGTFTPDAKVLAAQDGTPLIIRRNYGQGVVDYLTFDPGLEPFRSWADSGQVWAALLSTIGPAPAWTEGVVDSGSAFQSATFTRGLHLPDVAELAGFLALYILLIGPVNYFVLRWLHRPELAWVTIPLIILGTSVAAYVIGSSLRGTLPTLSRLSVVQIWPGEERARLDGVVGVLSPRRTTYSLSAGEGETLAALTGDPTGNALSNTSIPVKEAGRYTVSDMPIDSGLSATFETSAFVPAPALTGYATVTLSQGRSNIQGQVTNNSNLPLTESLAVYQNTPFVIGSLAPGETREFRFTATPQVESAPSVLNGYTINNSASRGSNNRFDRQSFSEIMKSAFAPILARGSNAEKQDVARRGYFVTGISDPNELGGGRGMDVYFLGWNDSSPLTAKLENIPYNVEDITLYSLRLPTRVVSEDGLTITAQPDAMLWTALEAPAQRASTPYNLYLLNNEQAVFQYAPRPGFPLGTVNTLTVNFSHSNTAGAGKLALWDWLASDWVEQAAKDNGDRYRSSFDLTDPADIRRYVGPNHAVRIRVQAADSVAGYDQLDVALGGQLSKQN